MSLVGHFKDLSESEAKLFDSGALVVQYGAARVALHAADLYAFLREHLPEAKSEQVDFQACYRRHGEVMQEWNRAPRAQAEPDPAVPPPEVIEAFARDCRCCPCCRQCPCPGVMAGGMCDDFACVHEDRDLMDDDTEEDDDGTLANW